MISYDDALNIAKKYIPVINYCEEREDAYTFGDINAQQSRGGLDSSCVIMKEDGSVHTFHQYVIKHLKAGVPKVIKVDYFVEGNDMQFRIDNFTKFLHEEATEKGLIFIEDCGDGPDKLTDTMLLEDVWGWAAPIGTDPDAIRTDDNYVCAEWKELDDSTFVINFVKYN